MGAQDNMEQAAGHIHAASGEATEIAVGCSAMQVEIESFLGRIAGWHAATGTDVVGEHMGAAIEQVNAAQVAGIGTTAGTDAMKLELDMNEKLGSNRELQAALGNAGKNLRMATFALKEAFELYGARSLELDEFEARANAIAHE